MEDAWEIRWFGGLGRDGAGDLDGDGMSDRAEFVSGTSPVDTADALRLGVPGRGEPVQLRFDAVAGRTYTVQRADDVNGAAWRKVADVPAAAERATVSVSDATGGAGVRFYRVVTPRIP